MSTTIQVNHALNNRAWHLAAAVSGCVLGSASFQGNTIWAMPFISPNGGTASSIGIGLLANVSASIRLMIYGTTGSSDRYPTALLYDSGAIDLSLLTAPCMARINPTYAFTPGLLYWLAVFTDNSGNSPTLQTIDEYLGYGIEVQVIGWRQTGSSPTYGALDGAGFGLHVGASWGAAPNPFPSGATVIASSLEPPDFIPALAIQF